MRIVFVLLMLTLGSSAFAGEQPHRSDRRDISQSCPQIYRAAIYVSQMTGLPMLTHCVNVLFHPPGASHGIPMDPRTLGNQGTTYYPQTDTVVMPLSADLNSAVGFSMLVHELVHAHQFANDRHELVPCRAALETEAYEVQARFLEDMGEIEQAERYRRKQRYAGRCRSAGDIYR